MASQALLSFSCVTNKIINYQHIIKPLSQHKLELKGFHTHIYIPPNNMTFKSWKLAQQSKKIYTRQDLGPLGPPEAPQHVSKIQRHWYVFGILKMNPVVAHIYAAQDLGPNGPLQAPGDIKGKWSSQCTSGVQELSYGFCFFNHENGPSSLQDMSHTNLVP